MHSNSLFFSYTASDHFLLVSFLQDRESHGGTAHWVSSLRFLQSPAVLPSLKSKSTNQKKPVLINAPLWPACFSCVSHWLALISGSSSGTSKPTGSRTTDALRLPSCPFSQTCMDSVLTGSPSHKILSLLFPNTFLSFSSSESPAHIYQLVLFILWCPPQDTFQFLLSGFPLGHSLPSPLPSVPRAP